MREIVIFGASGGGVKVAKTFNSLGIDFKFFVDNGTDKWGTNVEGKKVYAPSVLIGKVYSIVIASIYQEEIEKQLIDLGVDINDIIPKEKFILTALDKNINEYKNAVSRNVTCNNNKTFIIDLAEGLEIGGIETWSFVLTRALNKYGEKAYIYTSKTDKEGPTDLSSQIIKLDINYNAYKQSIVAVLLHMAVNLPCVFISNWMTQNFMAAYILKTIYPDKVKIIGVVHHDMLGYYRRNKYLENRVDKFLCVSCDTRTRMIDEFKVENDKVIYKEVIVPYDNNYIKKESVNEEPISINFASRLVKSQKRADFIIPLIAELEEKNVNYIMNIAGDGKYYHIIWDYVNQNKLKDKVILRGAIDYSEMSDFWRNGDIVISLSDSEGMGLSILEGMSYGLVPVVTNTAGISDFIENGVNGFICNLYDINQICSKLILLSQDRKYLNELSSSARNTIFMKCNDKGYIDLLKSF